MSSEIFKSYDIRGLSPEELSPQLAFRIGQAIAKVLKPKQVVIARDHRATSLSLRDAVIRGLSVLGVHVVDIGIADTPMLYFASSKLPVDAGIMITASHNPPEYNGMKICLSGAVPIGLDTGLSEIRDVALSLPEQSDEVVHVPIVRETDIRQAYLGFLASFADFGEHRFRVVTDTANAMGVLELPLFHRFRNITVVNELHASLGFPSPHEANPLKTETLVELQHVVRSARADIGLAYDGDADRIGFVDELGHVVPADLILALLARVTLDEYPNATILYDLRSTKSVREITEQLGGKAIESRVGHAHIKRAMKQHSAMLAGELAGHYYFNEGGYIAEMGSLPAIRIMNLMAKEGKSLSQLVAEVHLYAHSGEMNFKVSDQKKLFESVELHYREGKLSTLDGIKIVFPNWWLSLRASNTEPLVRLNLEADDQELLRVKTQELVSLIEKYQESK